MLLDPLMLRIICLAFALLFITAALHKFSGHERFIATLKDYQIIPVRLVAPIASVIALLEFGLAVGWLMSGLSVIATPAVALISVVLLGLYTFAIGLNLVRGRHHIDCGCQFSASLKNGQNSASLQVLSPALVLRNLFLIVVAAVTLIPASSRELGILDYFSLLASILAIALVFGAFNQLMTNISSINTWRKSHG